MKYTKIYIWALMLGIFSLSSCTEEDETFNAVTAGEADFTKFVTIGNSLTAGFASQGLYNDGMENGFGKIMSEQFALVGGGTFSNPLFPANQADGTGYQILTAFDPLVGTTTTGNNDYYINATGEFGQDGIIDEFTSPSFTLGAVNPAAIRGISMGGNALFTKYTGALNNFGVPGLWVRDINFPGYGTEAGNPFFERLLPDNDISTYLSFVTEQSADATFFSCWLGNNDVLNYALAGGVDPAPGTPGSLGITDETTFTANYNALIDALTANNAKGIVATVPNVTTAAHFITITEAGLLQPVNLSLPAGAPAFTEIFITTDAGVRAAEEGDLFILARQGDYASALGLGQGLLMAAPFSDDMVLDKDEVAEIMAATDAFNTIIQNKANEKGLAIFDTNAFLTRLLNQDYLGNGQFLGLGFITGGLFSLDGIHFTPRGNAFAANEMITAINAKYGSTIPLVNPNNYPGVTVTQ